MVGWRVDRVGLVFRYDWRVLFDDLSDSERGKLLMALLDYSTHGRVASPDELGDTAFMRFTFIAGQMDGEVVEIAGLGKPGNAKVHPGDAK